MTRIASVLLTVLVALAALWTAVEAGDQPQVNNPPEIEEFMFDFDVKAGNLLGIDTSDPRACTRVKVNFKVDIVDHEGDKVTVTMDLDGDTKLDDAKRTIDGSGTAVASKTYSTFGTIVLRFRACDVKGACSSILKTEFDVVACPPEFLDIYSEVEMGQMGKTATLTLSSHDVQDDKVTYELDWDEDNAYEVITKPSAPATPVKVVHEYQDQVIHWVNLRVCDTKDGCSQPAQRRF